MKEILPIITSSIPREKPRENWAWAHMVARQKSTCTFRFDSYELHSTKIAGISLEIETTYC